MCDNGVQSALAWCWSSCSSDRTLQLLTWHSFHPILQSQRFVLQLHNSTNSVVDETLDLCWCSTLHSSCRMTQLMTESDYLLLLLQSRMQFLQFADCVHD